ncbi:4-coumarate--CoA ligase 3-like [Coccinella septempunctata]|uniref:4-coumarate--CoA ligase 3-like n=1 Tax=Coccinella septempunctata TaxID=41139 RepID=UPI001D06E030|nr:4-coumarate--CoA ligase 3-like [Coccinella septempunctata]
MIHRRFPFKTLLVRFKLSAYQKRVKSHISKSYIVNSGFSDVAIPNVSLPEFFEEYHEKFHNFTAIECAVTRRKYNYGELRRKSTNLAKGLRKYLRLTDGDVVAIVLTNNPEFPIANLGILKANLTVTSVSPVFTPEEIHRQLVDANAKAIITEVDLAPTVKKALQKSLKDLPLIVVKTRTDQELMNGCIDFHEFVNKEIDDLVLSSVRPESVAFLPYSSGTTGLPKGVQLTHSNLVANIIQHNNPELRFKEYATDNYQEVLPTILPLYHIFGYNVVMNGIQLYGGKLVTIGKFNKGEFISMLENYQNSSIFYLVPPIVLLMIGNDRIKREYLRNIKAILSGAASLAASDEERFNEKFGNHIKTLQVYGLTEISPLATSLYPNEVEGSTSYKGTIGRPILNTQIKIVDPQDPNDTPLKPNARGELLVKGPQVMKGYLNRPEETKKSITHDGWLRTGDVGYYNEEGFFFITDRFKELIKVKGNQVPPAELEAIIRSFPGVLEAAVIGIPHETSGEVPRAYVVPKSGEVINVKDLTEFVDDKVAKYKKLAGGIALVSEIPKNASGKILRRVLKEDYLKKRS